MNGNDDWRDQSKVVVEDPNLEQQPDGKGGEAGGVSCLGTSSSGHSGEPAQRE